MKTDKWSSSIELNMFIMSKTAPSVRSGITSLSDRPALWDGLINPENETVASGYGFNPENETVASGYGFWPANW